MNKKIQLQSGIEVPAIGLGTWQLTGSLCREIVEKALKIGYRHIDTAEMYKNHKEIGRELENSPLDRSELFITTKVWYTHLSGQSIIDSAYKFQRELRTDYLDSLLIHWPNSEIPVRETLQAMKKLKKEGTIKTFGVSNFTRDLLKEAIETGLNIDLNQVEYHLSLNQNGLKNFCDKNNIAVTAYSPLGRGGDLGNTKVKELSEKYNKTPAQIILNWLLSKGLIVIPKASQEKHLRENIKSFDFEMDKKDIKQLENTSSKDNRIINPGFSEF
ncbi:MAG: aldo/keto reductase [Candidatus Magasanikbacteria bacterium]